MTENFLKKQLLSLKNQIKTNLHLHIPKYIHI